MKVSYKVLKKYIPHIESPEKVAQDLIMHTAEVESIQDQKKDFENIVYGRISSVDSHPNADSLKVCMVDVGESEDIQIVCGGSNLEAGQGVAVAKIGASVLWHGQGEPVVMKKTAIRGVESYGMICASEEIKLADEFPATSETEILDLSHIQATPGVNLAEVLGKDDCILEIDNKAINHRPDLFSHIWIAREIEAIHGNKLAYDLTQRDFSHLHDLDIQNDIPQTVKRYLGVQVSGVQNIASPEYVLDVLRSHDIESKGLLIDITNYSLYLYGQPTHCFDADKLTGNIHIRYATQGETFTALNDKEYTLTPQDIVIADDAGVIALGGIIGGKDSAVSDSTTNIIIESACFDQAIVRKTGKRLGLRTDALNIFEKELVPELSHIGASLIITELEKHFKALKEEKMSDIIHEHREQTRIPYMPKYIRNLIGKDYEETTVLDILHRIGVEKDGEMLIIPRWRKDLNNIADIAEEIARLDGYDEVQMTVPRINLGAVSQTPLYTSKRRIRNFLVSKGFFDMYTYSFVDETLMHKVLWNTENLVPLKNALTEEMTHMRGSLIPHLLEALSENKRDFWGMKLFECEKVFTRKNDDIQENYELTILFQENTDNGFYPARALLDELATNLGLTKYDCNMPKTHPSFAHAGRVADIVVRGKPAGTLGEIHPKVLKNFGLKGRVGYISLNLSQVAPALYGNIVAKEISHFQENNFDINFVLDKTTPGKNIIRAIEKSSPHITKVELFDIYENEEKLPGQRSLSFKVFFQSLTETLDDTVKNQIIEEVVKNVEKVGGKLR